MASSAPSTSSTAASGGTAGATDVKATGKNVAVVLHATKDMRVHDHAMPELQPGHVMVRMKALGICGSDVHYWQHGSIGPFVLKDPMVIGHESAGVVEQVASDVTTLKVGDRVAMEPGVSCRACKQCSSGRYNLCPKMEFFATPPFDGSFARLITHPADMCFKLPDGVSLEEGALCEPMSVAVHACRQAKLSAGHSVLILGAGPIGLMSMMVAKTFGATAITITDINGDRLDVAKTLGATGTVNVKGLSPQQASEAIRKSQGMPADVTIDACGFNTAFQAGLLSTAPGGTMCMVGLGQDMVSLPLAEATVREVTLVGVFRYRHTYPTCIKLIAAGLVDVKPLITHRFTVAPGEIAKGFQLAHKGTDGVIKVMFAIGDEDWDKHNDTRIPAASG